MQMVRNSSITLPITWSFLDADWQTNGAGYKTSTAFGFGLIDAEEFVQRSEKWKPIPEQLNCTFGIYICTKFLFLELKISLESNLNLDYTSCYFGVQAAWYYERTLQQARRKLWKTEGATL